MAQRVLRTFVRRLFTTLSALSLLLCLATVTLWVRSYWRQDGVFRFTHYNPPIYYKSMRSDGGYVVVESSVFRIEGLGPSDTGWSLSTRKPSQTKRSFRFDRASKNFGLETPHWSLALLFALLPNYSALSFIRQRKQRRPGRCAACGYDLRATPDRCPECGAVASSWATEKREGTERKSPLCALCVSVAKLLYRMPS